MKNPPYPFESHLKLAHYYWQLHLKPGDSAIDATCGNGHDTAFLAQICLSAPSGRVYGFDIQPQALENTQNRLQSILSSEQLNQVHLFLSSHTELAKAQTASGSAIKLIVYNLGYLPGGNKTETTFANSTLESLQSACEILSPGGLISITCYPGHPAGAIEEQALLDYTSSLSRPAWNCCHHRWINRQNAPSLLLMQKQ